MVSHSEYAALYVYWMFSIKGLRRVKIRGGVRSYQLLLDVLALGDGAAPEGRQGL